MTSCAAGRAAAACGAGSVRERLMTAFARGGGSVGESTRGGLPSRPPAAPAWTGSGEGGGRALGPAGLAMASARLSKSMFGVGLCRVHGRPCYPDAPRPRAGLRSGPRPRREWVGIRDKMSGPGPAAGDGAYGPGQGYGVQLVSTGGVCVTGASGGGFDDVGDGPGFVGRRCGLRRGGRECMPLLVWGPLAGSMAALPSRWTWLGVGTGQRCLRVCWHGQAFLCLAAPLSRWRMVCGLRVWIGSGGLATPSHVSAGF